MRRAVMVGEREDFAPTCEPGIESAYRAGYIDGCERALQLMLDVWAPQDRGNGWGLAYRACAGYVARLEEWARTDPGLLHEPPEWPGVCCIAKVSDG